MNKYDYSYTESDPYCYADSKVLVNKLNIRDTTVLYEAEREITCFKLLELHEKPINGRFGFAHLCAIHEFIFCDVYNWAGIPRTGGFLSKSGTLFVQGIYIKDTANKLFTELSSENKLRGLEKEVFIRRLAYYMGEVNALHPFREGNGRTAREFFRELALKAEHCIDYGLTEADTLLNADVEAYAKNYDPLINVLHSIVTI